MRPDTSQRRTLRRMAWAAGLVGAGMTAAVAFASEKKPEFEPGSLFDKMQQEIVAPAKILSSARIEGIADTVGPISEDLTNRIEWLQDEIEKLKDLPGMAARVPSELIQAAYTSGVEDALRYGYGEEELDQIVTNVGAMGPEITTLGLAIQGKLIGAGVDRAEAAQTAFWAVQAGTVSSIRSSDSLITELSTHVQSWKYSWACQGCGPLQVEAAINIPFEGVLAVSEHMDGALLFSLNDRLDVEEAFARVKSDPDLLLADLGM